MTDDRRTVQVRRSEVVSSMQRNQVRYAGLLASLLGTRTLRTEQRASLRTEPSDATNRGIGAPGIARNGAFLLGSSQDATRDLHRRTWSCKPVSVLQARPRPVGHFHLAVGGPPRPWRTGRRVDVLNPRGRNAWEASLLHTQTFFRSFGF